MVKNFVKSMLTLGLLLSVPQFSVSKASAIAEQMESFEASLQPHDLALLEQDEPMVWMSPDFVEVMKKFTSNNQAVNDLVTHVSLGYSLAPMKDVSAAVEHAMKSCDQRSSAYAVIKNYHSALLSGDAVVRTEEEMGNRRKRKCGKFCQLFVQNCASVGSLNVRCNANVCGDLCVGGTVRACNFSFTGNCGTGCTGTSAFPNISACGNIQFNTAGTNTLNVQGAVESRMKHIMGNISITNAGGLTLTSAAADSPVVITAGTFPTATATSGSGFTVGAVTGSGRSSGVVVTTDATEGYNFVIDLLIPVTFAGAYSTVPTLFLNAQSAAAFVNAGVTNLVNATTSTEITLGSSAVSVNAGTINLLLNVFASGADYATALANAQAALRLVLNNGLSINFISDGRVA